MTALLTLAAGAPAHAQTQNNNDQSVPDAPQPQKKPAAKPQSSDSGSQPKDKTKSEPQASDSSSPPNDKTAPNPKPSTKDENPFPEAVSKDAAAKAAAGSSDSDHPADSGNDKTAPNPKPSTKDENPFPEAVSKDAAAKAAAASSDSDHPSDSEKDKTAPNPKPSTKDENPFPEAVSKDAAKAAGNDPDQAPPAKTDLPPGVSSSQSGLDGGENEAGAPNQVADPVRAKKDAGVGDYYLKSHDYQGALNRYQDATMADPTNVEAIFGLAESQRMLNKNADAARNYQLYLEIVPNGPKAKQALKALKTLGSGG
jgi:hypothetical protein